MKNVIIINSYANTDERKNVLINCINQLKKLNIDIILISNYTDDESIQKSVDHYLYDSDNFLLPKDKSPLNWYADSKETIHTFHPGTSYIVYKNICTAINHANSLGYEKFFYLEFDVNFSDEDLTKINIIFDDCLYSKEFWMCNFYHYEKDCYETRLFAGHVSFFIKNFIHIKSKFDWFNTYPFSTTSDTLEFILPLFIKKSNDLIHFTNVAVCDFFKTSKFDVCHSFSHVYIAYNTENINEPIIFLITDIGKYNIIINNKLEYSNDHINNQILKHKFIISNDNTNVKILHNNIIIFNECVTLHNIEEYKQKCIRYKL
jgi:hypothetical protein